MKKTFIHQHSCSLKYTILFYDMGSYFKTLLFFLFLKESFLAQLFAYPLLSQQCSSCISYTHIYSVNLLRMHAFLPSSFFR